MQTLGQAQPLAHTLPGPGRGLSPELPPGTGREISEEGTARTGQPRSNVQQSGGSHFSTRTVPLASKVIFASGEDNACH